MAMKAMKRRAMRRGDGHEEGEGHEEGDGHEEGYGYEEGDGDEGHEEGDESDGDEGHEAQGHEEGHEGGGRVSRWSAFTEAEGVRGLHVLRTWSQRLCVGSESLRAPGLLAVYIHGGLKAH